MELEAALTIATRRTATEPTAETALTCAYLCGAAPQLGVRDTVDALLAGPAKNTLMVRMAAVAVLGKMPTCPKRLPVSSKPVVARKAAT